MHLPGKQIAQDTNRNETHQGIPIPRSQCHNLMISMEGGGPARTRTWDQGIMRNTNSQPLLKKGKEA